jgi:VanZ family protein
VRKLNIEVIPRWLRDIAPLIFWLALIFILSDQPRLLEIKNEAGEKTFYNSAHIIAYAILAWLWWRALAPRRQTTWPILWIAFVLTVLYGISDEIHQRFVPGRHGLLTDVFFDASGALLMVLLLRRLEWLRHFPEALLFSVKVKQEKRQPEVLRGE